MQEFLQQLVNGLSVGAIYALIAVGYTMVYGVLQLINFAHGDIFMVGAMLALLAARFFGFTEAGHTTESWLAFGAMATVAIVGCGILGWLIERLAYRPLRGKPRINSLITAIGISLLLEYGGQHRKVFGATPQAFPYEIIPGIGKNIQFAGLTIARVDVLIVVTTLVLLAALTYIVMYTKTGLALRAVSFRFDTSSLMGIDINKVISFTFILGSTLAAAAGVLYAVKYPKVEPLMGLLPGVKAFTAAVFGGIGNLTGAVIGALVLGVVEAMVVGYLPGGSNYKDGVAFFILIGILLAKPSGLLGKNVVEKV